MDSAPERHSGRNAIQANGRSPTIDAPDRVHGTAANGNEGAFSPVCAARRTAADERDSMPACQHTARTSHPTDFALSAVTLVIPGRNVAAVVRYCLESVVPLLESGELTEIIFVDDASTDTTAQIVAEYPVTLLCGRGAGPGSARNVGWQAARTPLVWFIDADCVAEPEALRSLREQLTNDGVAAVGGSYANMRPDSLLATLIHEEIVARHQHMKGAVTFLATFNVLYRRSILHELGGFDEQFRLAQDADLAFRAVSKGYRLHFERTSRVGHFHATRLWRYLKTQARQGCYRVLLYRRHPQRLCGDHYSGLVDHMQPPLALLSGFIVLIAAWWPLTWTFWSALVTGTAFLGTALPMTIRIVGRRRQLRFLAFLPFCCLRATARAAGLVAGLFRWPNMPALVKQ